MSEFASYAEMSQKNALFYKNIIRNDKLRKLTSEDFFKKTKKLFFSIFSCDMQLCNSTFPSVVSLFVSLRVCEFVTQKCPKNLFFKTGMVPVNSIILF